MDLSIYIARQPIYTENGEIIAYELLYRNTAENQADVDNNLHATARVLVNTMHYIGLQRLTDKKRAFLKVDYRTLSDDLIFSISPEHFVFEIIDNSELSPLLYHRMEVLHDRGYRFALKHADRRDENQLYFKSVLPLINYMKIDYRTCIDPADTITRLKNYTFKLIAEKIETEEDFKRVKSYGFDYFQGYYFCKPELFNRARLDPPERLLSLIIYMLRMNSPLDRIIHTFNASPQLTVNLLKFIHQHHGIKHGHIMSIEQAIILLGRSSLEHWLRLMLYASDGNDNENYTKELGKRAHQRAKLMQELARQIEMEPATIQAAYMTGLLSMSDTINRQSFTDVFREVHLNSAITDALLHGSGELGTLLKLVLNIERDNIVKVTTLIHDLGLSQSQLNRALLKSYSKSE